MELIERIANIIQKFSEKKILIAIAESCTGGYVSHMFTNISGASKIFERGVITYGNQAKIDILKVNPKDLDKYGAVSEEIAHQMAYNVRVMSKLCDIGIGITGIAGPTGGTPEKPVGLVFIGFSTEKENFVKKFNFKTDRITFKKKVLKEVVDFLENYPLG
ncbi:MAG: CinA family protein [Promethearchaeota archaeon]